MTIYRIMGCYKAGDSEEIDVVEADESPEEAETLLSEYMFAFGKDWDLWIETQE